MFWRMNFNLKTNIFSFQPQNLDLSAKVQYSYEWPINLEQIRDRVMLVLKLYDKINPEKVRTV